MTTSAAYRSIVSSCLTRARTNLFNSWRNSVLSLATIAAGGIAGFLMLRFVLFQANWGLVAINRKLFFVGSYPSDETYRIWISLFLVGMLVTLTYGLWVGRLRPFLVVLGAVAAITLTLGLGTEFHIEEREYREEIRSGDQVSVISGIQR
jgi:general L-amino acid transport system permease protein